MTKVSCSIKPTVLYRLFAADGVLLYVGITVDPAMRWKVHGEQKSWWTSVDTIRVEHYPHRRAAQKAEQEAIAAELPRYNQCEYPGRHPNSHLAERSGWSTERGWRTREHVRRITDAARAERETSPALPQRPERVED